MKFINSLEIKLRKSIIKDLEIFYTNQLDKEANFMAAFTAKDPTDKEETYFSKWKNLLKDESVNLQTILYNGNVAGSIAKFVSDGNAEITYWIGKEFWGKGIANKALKQFLLIEKTRPILGRVAFDNFGSQKVLEKCGFKKVGTDKFFSNARGKEIEEFIYRLDA